MRWARSGGGRAAEEALRSVAGFEGTLGNPAQLLSGNQSGGGLGGKGCGEVFWGVPLCLDRSFRSVVGGAAEEAISDGRRFEDPAVNPARRLGGKQKRGGVEGGR